MKREYVEIVFSAVIALATATALWDARSWPVQAQFVPVAIAVPLLTLALLQLAFSVRKLRTEPLGSADLEQAAAVKPDTGGVDIDSRRTVEIALWIGAFWLGLAAFGFLVAAPLLTFVFLRFAGGERIRTSVTIAAATYLVLKVGFDLTLHLPFSAGLIPEMLGLPSLDSYIVDLVRTLLGGIVGGARPL